MLLKIRRIPDFSEGPVVIIAGLPNVGKSSLLSRITGSTPEIKPYPFTTKGLMTGYWNGIQFIDTPGLLDRPMEDRNEIEKQAITAIAELGDLIIYVFDASESAGDIDTQLSLFKEISERFNKPVIKVINKIDIKTDFPVEGVKISCLTGDGIDTLKSVILEYLSKSGKEKSG
jgi:nucleolar GTP-binding protein